MIKTNHCRTVWDCKIITGCVQPVGDIAGDIMGMQRYNGTLMEDQRGDQRFHIKGFSQHHLQSGEPLNNEHNFDSQLRPKEV